MNTVMEKKIYIGAIPVEDGYKIKQFDNWDDCKEFCLGVSGSKYKKFTSQTEADVFIEQLGGKRVGKGEKRKIVRRRQKFCILCESPVNVKGELCSSCYSKRAKLREILAEAYPDEFKISDNKLLYLQNYYSEHKDDILDYLIKNPEKALKRVPTAVARNKKREHKEYLASEKYKSQLFIKGYSNAPIYIKNTFSKLGNYEFLAIEGEKKDPRIIFKCKRCNVEICARYSQISKAIKHGCDKTKSSGELIVENYLKEKRIRYKTQRDTLLCENPLTGHQLPYDFELIDDKVIIEVQGNQHLDFTAYFHGDEEAFEYQKWKDYYKRRFAEKQGYVFIEIFYPMLESGEYITILENVASNRKGEPPQPVKKKIEVPDYYAYTALPSKKVHKTKSTCMYYDVGNCSKFNCRCFDCKDY